MVSPISPPLDSQVAVRKDHYTYSANLSLSLDMNGKITAKVHAQDHLKGAAQFALANSRLQLFPRLFFISQFTATVTVL